MSLEHDHILNCARPNPFFVSHLRFSLPESAFIASFFRIASMATLPTPADILSWPKANYINPDTRRPLVLGVEIPLTILTILFTAGRFYSRTVIVKALGWDDWFMLLATIFSTATNVMTCVSVAPAYQTGYHLWDLRPEILINPYQAAQVRTYPYIHFIVACSMLVINTISRWRWLVNCSTFQSVSSPRYHF
jgi:hypothetical protein